MNPRLIEDLRSQDVRFYARAGALLVDTLASGHGPLLVDEHLAVLE
jgi:hypothetical protein